MMQTTPEVKEQENQENANWDEHITLEEPTFDSSPEAVDNTQSQIPDHPEEVRTSLTFSQAGLPKIVLVTSVCLGGGALLLLVLRGTIGGVDWSGERTVSQASTVQSDEPQDAKEREIGSLKAQLAVGDAAKRMEALESTKGNTQAASRANNTERPATQTKTVQYVTATTLPPPKPVNNYSSPQDFRLVTRTVKNQPTLASVKPTQQEATQVDPMEQWLAASNQGILGKKSTNSRSENSGAQVLESTNDVQLTNTTDENDAANRFSGGIGTTPKQMSTGETIQNNFRFPAPIASDSSRNEDFVGSNRAATPLPDRPIDRSATPLQLIVGTKAKGKLETGISWSGNLQDVTQLFRVKLTEALLANDRTTVVVPEGAYLVARIDNATSAGQLEMSVISVLIEENGKIIEKPLPEAAVRQRVIRILGKGGNYLQAQVTRRRNNQNNVGTTVLSGISNMAGLSNQASYQASYNNGFFNTTATSRDPNYVAGFGQGVANEILRQQQEHNLRVRQSSQLQPDILTVKGGTTVQIYVNQSMTWE